MPPRSVLVTFAVPEEARPFRRIAPAYARLLVTGMGRTRARRVVTHALGESRPDLVLTCGFAGALRPHCAIGTLLLESDPGFPLHDLLLRAGAQPGRILCADRVASRASDKSLLRHETQADAVEMESGEIRALCRELGIPSATLRAISDTAEADLPLDFNALMTADQRLDPLKLAFHILRHPFVIPRLLRLQKDCAVAARQLAAALALALA
ncbi:MAG: hypothetical protein IT580_03590 [Verrucomicrobiales bacterium]|jgi:adenosylhomocysteine nucleosidase|nr:hypothetical protein [Verrucomicrobiales bacterium]